MFKQLWSNKKWKRFKLNLDAMVLHRENCKGGQIIYWISHDTNKQHWNYFGSCNKIFSIWFESVWWFAVNVYDSTIFPPLIFFFRLFYVYAFKKHFHVCEFMLKSESFAIEAGTKRNRDKSIKTQNYFSFLRKVFVCELALDLRVFPLSSFSIFLRPFVSLLVFSHPDKICFAGLVFLDVSTRALQSKFVVSLALKNY